MESDPAQEWAQVEVFGHRRHFGRITEVERFGAKLLRLDVPTEDVDVFDTLFYAGAAIFSLTPVTEASCRAWAARARPANVRLPPPDIEYDADNAADDAEDE